MHTDPPMNVETFIDSQPLSRFQKRILILCFLVVAVDGFDTSGIGFIGPAIRADWHLAAAALAPLFGAGLLGLTAGALLFGPLADRYGRKRILIAAIAVFGLASLAAAASTSLTILIALRFLTGVGLGGAMPNAVTLSREYSPASRGSSLVTLMFCGFTIGGALGGLVSAQFVSTIGWRGVLAVGGIAPLALVPLLAWALPESLEFLLLRGTSRDAVLAEKIAARILPAGAPRVLLRSEEKALTQTSSARALFAPRMASITVLLWTTFFMILLIVYLLTSWMPLLLAAAGVSLKQASLMTMMYQVGATIGGVWLGRRMDRSNPQRVLALAFLVATGLFVVCAFSVGSKAIIVTTILGIGFCVGGGTIGGYVLSGSYYPTSSRATGVAWANAAGRVGAVLGSMLGGALISVGVTFQTFLLSLAVPGVIATLSMLGLERLRREQALLEPLTSRTLEPVTEPAPRTGV
ncbi:MFS transporter [Paraburkholderia sp. BCC1886]|uniref:MFS transporter n=1 Tax=Paraburkholderia sp. BCC1886 TaxID=2562670 RepID=UPI0021B48A0B|nr:MFS transporter [Paraburkholderia sp. BCC1886]